LHVIRLKPAYRPLLGWECLLSTWPSGRYSRWSISDTPWPSRKGIGGANRSRQSIDWNCREFFGKVHSSHDRYVYTGRYFPSEAFVLSPKSSSNAPVGSCAATPMACFIHLPDDHLSGGDGRVGCAQHQLRESPVQVTSATSFRRCRFGLRHGSHIRLPNAHGLKPAGDAKA
jgi:hypothetical protein